MRIKKLRAGVIAERPSADRDGGLYADKTNKTIWQFVSGVWSSIVRFVRSSSAPVGAIEGDIYLSSVDNRPYVYANGQWQKFAIGVDFIQNSLTQQSGNFNILGTGTILGKLSVQWRDAGSTHEIKGASLTINTGGGITETLSGSTNLPMRLMSNNADKGGIYYYTLNIFNRAETGAVIGYALGQLNFVTNNSTLSVGAGASFGSSFVFDSQSAANNPIGLVLLYNDGKTPIRFKKSGVVNLPLLSTYADNTAASAAGLVAGDLYKTATGNVMVVY